MPALGYFRDVSVVGSAIEYDRLGRSYWGSILYQSGSPEIASISDGLPAALHANIKSEEKCSRSLAHSWNRTSCYPGSSLHSHRSWGTHPVHEMDMAIYHLVLLIRGLYLDQRPSHQPRSAADRHLNPPGSQSGDADNERMYFRHPRL
jgi:hypothetical protein